MTGILDQEEIDALMQVDDKSSTFVSTDTGSLESFNSIDFDKKNDIKEDLLTALNKINDSFITQLTKILTSAFDSDIKVEATHTECDFFEAYSHTQSGLISVNGLLANPQAMSLLLIIDAPLIASSLDVFFGAFQSTKMDRGMHPFTASEHKIRQVIVESVINALNQAYQPIGIEMFEFESHIATISLNQSFSDQDRILLSRFTLLQHQEMGFFDIVWPLSAITVLIERVSNPSKSMNLAQDEQWNNRLMRNISHVDVDVSILIDEVTMTLREFLALAQGDIIPVESPDEVVGFIESQRFFYGRYGVQDQTQAVEITDMINPKI